MPVIVSVVIVAFLVLIGWMWNNLGNIDIQTKIIRMIVGLGIVCLLTFIIFNISKMGIKYETEEVMGTVRRVFVIIFTIVNGYVILPYLYRIMDKVQNDEIKKEKLQRSIIIFLIIVVILFTFEIVYLGSLQQSVLDIMKK